MEEVNPYYILLDSYDESLIIRKKYVDGEWVDTTADEAAKDDAKYYSINGEWLDDKIVALDNEIDNHTHTGYASSDDLALLEDVVDTKANATHTHSEYASVSHAHSDYATVTALDTLDAELDSKANTSHTHTEYASATHSHSEYASTGHNHDEDYASIDHTHSNYATTTALSELATTVSGKANESHSHNDIYYTETEINTKLADKADSDHNHTGVYDVNGAAASALSSANSYTDTAIDTLSETVATKADASTLTSHTGNTTVHIASTERSNWNAAKTHANSAHAPSNAEENQNAFSNVVIGSTTISADAKTDTLTLVAGNNITLTPDSTGDSITITSANTVYSHPTTSGNKHIPSGGASGQILRWSADGTAVWGNDNNTTYSNATQSASGLMSDTDKTKLDGIAVGANKYVLPSAGSALGGVKTGGDVTISSGVITVNDDSHNHVISNVDGLQSALDAKATASNLTSHTSNVSNPHSVTLSQLGVTATASELNKMDGVTATTAEINILDGVTATTAELNYVDGVTSNIQTQLNGKASASHTHNYAGSSSAGGAATSANKLNTNAGSATQPVYFANGIPVACTYTLGKSVPSNAVFTDTTYSVVTASANGLMSASDKSKLDAMVIATVSEVETYLGI